MKTKEDKLKLLDETAKFFNLGNRCVHHLKCRYFIEGMAGCAIGRLIEDKELCREFDRLDWPGVSNNHTFGLLPLDLQEYGQDFLSKLQDLHDIESNWDENGLNLNGKIRYNKIKSGINAEVY